MIMDVQWCILSLSNVTLEFEKKVQQIWEDSPFSAVIDGGNHIAKSKNA